MKAASRSTSELRARAATLERHWRGRAGALLREFVDGRVRGGRGPARIVPESSVAGRALTMVLAIMSFLACLTVGVVTLVSDASRDWQSDIGREITIQVRPIEEVDLAGEARKALAIVRATPGVASARLLDQTENARLLEPWLGSGLDLRELPLPMLIVLEVGDPQAVRLDRLSQRLRTEVRGASLDDHRAWIDRLRTMARTTVGVGVAILALVFVATVLCVVFATRGAMAGSRDIISVLHFVGAEDRFIAAEFQRHFLLLGFKGGLIGAAAAAVLFAVLSFIMGRSIATPEADQMALLFGRFAIGWTGYLGAFGVAVVVALMTAVTSRLTVFRTLAEVE